MMEHAFAGYEVNKDGTFVLQPEGLSGETIRGVWRSADSLHVTVTGKWGWANGVSLANDFRRMTLILKHIGQLRRAYVQFVKLRLRVDVVLRT